MPTLIIGLGGTGTKVVRNIREHWDLVGAPADCALAVIDARAGGPEGGPVDSAFFRTCEPLNYEREFSQFSSHVAPWWPRNVHPDAAIDFTEGCGAVRANGRFFAFRYARTIENTLSDAIQRLVAKSQGNQAARSFTIYIIASLGNGTGGGTFMDVATICRHRLSATAQQIQVIGVFVPGSVTRRYWQGNIVEPRIASAGYASLIELQYEMNRLTSNEWRPRQPFMFQAFNGVSFTDFSPAPHQSDPTRVSPIDWAFVLDYRDRNGLEINYPSLLNVAAEGICMMVSGTDGGARMLDGYVQAQPGRHFCSFGAVRLSVPASRLLDLAVHQQTLRAAATARTRLADEGGAAHEKACRDLLAESNVDGTRQLFAADASVRKSVAFTIAELLRVEEVVSNQVIDRFAMADEDLRDQFKSRLNGIDELKNAADIANKASEIQNFVQDNLEGLKEARMSLLLEDWARTPRNPEKPHDAGLKWIIDRRVDRFVRGGTFGLLADWLEEFKTQIKQNKESITANERRKYLSIPAHGALDLDRMAQELRESAERFFANIFGRGRLIEQIGQMAGDAKLKFDFVLWTATLEAVEAIYSKMYAYADMLQKGAVACCSLFRHPRMHDLPTKTLESIQKELDNAQSGKENLQEGIKAEFWIGIDGPSRERILGEVEKDAGSSAVGLLAGLADRWTPEYVASLGADSGEFTGKPAISRSEDVERADAIRNDIERLARVRVKDIIGTGCRIDKILEEEARMQLAEYFRLVYTEADAVDRQPLLKFLKELSRLIGEQAVEQIRRLPWDRDRSAAMDQAIDLFIAGRLWQVSRNASAQWMISYRHEQGSQIIQFPFMVYNGSANRIPRALDLIPTLGVAGQNQPIHAQRNDFIDPRCVDILIVEMNASLESLEMLEEVTAYRDVVRSDDFCPHTTEAYRAIGRQYLDRTGAQRREGAALLALGIHCDLIAELAGGNFKLKKELKVRDITEGEALPFAADWQVGRSLEGVAADLDGTDPTFVRLKRGLKQNVYRILKDRAFGAPPVPGIAWKGVADQIRSLAAEIERKARSNPDTSAASVMSKQASDLATVANELETLNGQGLPALFR